MMKDSKIKINWPNVLVWLVLIPGIGIFMLIQLWNLVGWLFGG